MLSLSLFLSSVNKGTFMEMFVDMMGPLVQILTSRFGLKFVLVLGGLLMTLGLQMASLTSEIWHLYLSQGICFGTGASFMFVIAMGILPQWFNKRRGLATGLASSGSGIGGLVLPFILTAVNDTLGIGWSYRVLGFIILGCSTIACICLRERVRTTDKTTKLSQIFNFEVLKDLNFVLWVLGSMIGLMGFFVPYFFLPSYITYLGMSTGDSATIIAVLSAANFVGRITIGYISDRIGRLNTDIIFLILAGLSSFLIWTFAYDYQTLMGFAVMFGFCNASYFSLLSPITATILGMKRYPTGLSILLLSNAISVYGPSIASAIQTRVDTEPYLTYKIFTGFVYVLGGLILIVLKIRMTKSLLSVI
ncbi:mfs transporter [Lichtheimia corymbifera JMRC:FSU:9682]|uniref:Mfs transporter n=1 Tax=Lichtheimia corymbifera JMRC:FSU:9682 TaxID=1263082 RepID=A0A068RIM3_9FUNG|nr:mfs transporter [Lichtheimia corymbifera JMRC:FSU:9682]